MKIIVVSDSHGSYEKLNKIALENQDAYLYLHLGDFEIPEYLMNPYCFIKGNCDFLSDAPIFKDIPTPYGIIHLEHGNHIPYTTFDEYVKSKNCFIFLFGHTHQKYQGKVNETLVLNPGSVSKPRDSNKGSYLILDINSKTDIKVTFKEIDL